MLASEKSTKIIARDPKSSTRNETVVKLSRSSLTITKPAISHQIDLCFDTLVPDTLPNLFSLRSQNAKKLAWDIERIILVLLPNSGNYYFECYWDSGTVNHDVDLENKSEGIIKDESLKLLETKFNIVLPLYYRNFLSIISEMTNSNDDQNYNQFFVSEAELLSANERVRNTFPYCDVWRDDWFVIGTDGSGNDYFIVTGNNDENIYELDHEQVQDNDYNPLLDSRYSSLNQVNWKRELRR